MSESKTSFINRCQILSELWLDYRKDEEFQDFCEYSDLGLPLAYAITSKIVTSTPKAEMYINETWDLLMGALEIEDEGYESLDDLMIGLSEG